MRLNTTNKSKNWSFLIKISTLKELCNERKFHCVKRLFGLSNQIGGKVKKKKKKKKKLAGKSN